MVANGRVGYQFLPTPGWTVPLLYLVGGRAIILFVAEREDGIRTLQLVSDPLLLASLAGAAAPVKCAFGRFTGDVSGSHDDWIARREGGCDRWAHEWRGSDNGSRTCGDGWAGGRKRAHTSVVVSLYLDRREGLVKDGHLVDTPMHAVGRGGTRPPDCKHTSA
jgi:hypothetical protein